MERGVPSSAPLNFPVPAKSGSFVFLTKSADFRSNEVGDEDATTDKDTEKDQDASKYILVGIGFHGMK